MTLERCSRVILRYSVCYGLYIQTSLCLWYRVMLKYIGALSLLHERPWVTDYVTKIWFEIFAHSGHIVLKCGSLRTLHGKADWLFYLRTLPNCSETADHKNTVEYVLESPTNPWINIIVLLMLELVSLYYGVDGERHVRYGLYVTDSTKWTHSLLIIYMQSKHNFIDKLNIQNVKQVVCDSLILIWLL